jgi:hypothetical protein
VELLIVSSKGELSVALDTSEGSVGVVQVFHSLFLGLVNVLPELEDYEVQSQVQSVLGRY